MISSALHEKAAYLLEVARQNEVRITSVESCTGGLIAALLTQIPGASDVIECGFVTYSNHAKTELVGVPSALIDRHGAVSKQVAIAMARGGLRISKAEMAVAVTGIAGPGGGSPTKPVGLVHLAVATLWSRPIIHVEVRFSLLERAAIRQATVAKAFDLMLECLSLK